MDLPDKDVLSLNRKYLDEGERCCNCCSSLYSVAHCYQSIVNSVLVLEFGVEECYLTNYLIKHISVNSTGRRLKNNYHGGG